VSPAELPESVLHTVIRTRESVILGDALVQNPFSADEYICQKLARSVLCLPLVKQSKLIGVLYLETTCIARVHALPDLGTGIARISSGDHDPDNVRFDQRDPGSRS